jgi:hemoglobin
VELVHGFYARVRRDHVLGPIFDAHVHDWESHLRTLVDFWSSILRGTGRFNGTPMAKHAALPGLSADLFGRWLALFGETAAVQPNQVMAQRAQVLANRIAQSLWYGYQLAHAPNDAPKALDHE